MVNYVRAAATAKRLIEANGRDVTLVRKNQTPADAAKPWRQPASAVDVTVGTVKGVFYPIEEKLPDGSLVRKAEEKLMIAHDSLDPSQNLEDIDHVLDGMKKYKVIEACPLGPGDVRIAYEFLVKR